ncbi:MAG TPA: hydantoinase B/oxoprolinase family protein [Thermoleophilaceae bacterium]|nr:hydantoinase B/oxoprolinase family protein [Thermoleophilaceae bacterium]
MATRSESRASAGTSDIHAYLENYPRLDPITAQVISNGLISACREMGIAMVRTAYSPIFVEGHDFSCAILDGRGDMAASWAFAAIHLSAMPYAARWAAVEFGFENLEAGDVIVHNDPFRGGSHLPDITMVKPIFVDGQLVAMAANRSHHVDVGGKARGGMPGDTTDVHQEGVRIPPVRWFRGGEEQTDILDFLLANVRLPHLQVGDFRAMLASAVTAERRVIEFCERYGTETFLEALSAGQDYSERRMRAAIAAMPDGTYEYEDYMEDDGRVDKFYRIKVALTIDHDELTVDLTGTSKEAQGPINMPFAVTSSNVFNTLLQVSDPDIPFNQGCYRPVRVIAPRRTIVNAQYPAPVAGGNTDTSQRLLDALYGAFTQAVPDRVIAGTYGTALQISGGGWDDLRRQRTAFYFFPEGGWGGGPWGDGYSATTVINGNTKDIPVEIAETSYPIRYDHIRLNVDGEGAGRHRGGFGTVRTWTVLNEQMELNSMGDRVQLGPSGVVGGDPAVPSAMKIRREGDTKFRSFADVFGVMSPSKFANIPVQRGDSIMTMSACGGGYGDPLERDPELVLDDVRQGLVSRRRAREDYGVALRTTNGELRVDVRTTEDVRSALREDPARADAYRLGDGLISPHERRRTITEDDIVAPPDESSGVALEEARIARAVAQIDKSICLSACPKQADPHRCPIHNPESLEYWGVELLKQWLDRNCPQNPRV